MYNSALKTIGSVADVARVTVNDQSFNI